MKFFKSSLERRYWLYAFIVWVAIFSTLMIGQPLQKFLMDQQMQAVIFVMGMGLIGLTIVMHGLKRISSPNEILIWLGMIAVYLMLFLRLGAPERSHLIEYSVLAVFIHKAITERQGQRQILRSAFIAFIITAFIGILDECIQLFLPNRVFDFNDLLFNLLAVLLAVGGGISLQWAKKRFIKN